MPYKRFIASTTDVCTRVFGSHLAVRITSKKSLSLSLSLSLLPKQHVLFSVGTGREESLSSYLKIVVHATGDRRNTRRQNKSG